MVPLRSLDSLVISTPQMAGIPHSTFNTGHSTDWGHSAFRRIAWAFGIRRIPLSIPLSVPLSIPLSVFHRVYSTEYSADCIAEHSAGYSAGQSAGHSAGQSAGHSAGQKKRCSNNVTRNETEAAECSTTLRLPLSLFRKQVYVSAGARKC